MLLELGHYDFDVTSRTLVMATVVASDTSRDQSAKVLEFGADLILLTGAPPQLPATVATLVDLDAPIVVASSDADLIAPCLAAGLSLAVNPDEVVDADYLATIRDADASVMLVDPAPALAAGIPSTRIVCLNRPELVPPGIVSGTSISVHEDAQGAAVAMVMAGARLLHLSQVPNKEVRAVRRTVDTIAELLERRGPAATPAVQPIGAL